MRTNEPVKRPKQRIAWITIRVTPQERACIEKLARQRNITITQLLLSGVAKK